MPSRYGSPVCGTACSNIVSIFGRISDSFSVVSIFTGSGKPHGSPGSSHSHAGDLPNLKADANGNANYSAKVHGITVNTGPAGIVGRSVVIHRDPDDYKSQPAGNSGPRLACGLIRSS